MNRREFLILGGWATVGACVLASAGSLSARDGIRQTAHQVRPSANWLHGSARTGCAQVPGPKFPDR